MPRSESPCHPLRSWPSPAASSEAEYKGGKRFLRLAKSAQKSLCGAGSDPHAEGSFFLYEKSVLRESDSLRGRNQEVCTDLTPPLFSALQKPFK